MTHSSNLSGLMMRDGYWLNLTDLSWTQRRFPPYPPFLEDERLLPDKMVSFRDAPTIFGNTQVGTVTTYKRRVYKCVFTAAFLLSPLPCCAKFEC